MGRKDSIKSNKAYFDSKKRFKTIERGKMKSHFIKEANLFIELDARLPQKQIERRIEHWKFSHPQYLQSWLLAG